MFPKNDEIHVYRKSSNIVYEGELIERKINVEPESSSLFQVELDSAQTGTLFIYGSSSETLTFSNIKSQESVNSYTLLEGMTPSSLSGEITFKAVNVGGEFISETDRVSSFNGMYAEKTTGQYFKLYGMDAKFRGIIFAPYDVDVLIGDLIKIDRVDMDGYYEVEEIYEPRLFGRTQHKEIILMYNK